MSMTFLPRCGAASLRTIIAGVTLLCASPALVPSPASSATFAPQTKIRLAIVQWVPSRGQYERWDALGGEYSVSDDGKILLPYVGALDVEHLDKAGLTKEVARLLQQRIKLLQPPGVTIEILEYPPIYVVGDVTTPGEYKFRSGLTVLQAVAMSGGARRATSQQRTQEIRLVADLQDINLLILRKSLKKARLQAELDGATEIRFDPPPGADPQYAKTIYNEEQIIFRARASAVERQAKALTELRELLGSERLMLEEKLKGAEEDIKALEGQLSSIRSLVEQRIAVASRQLELERMLTTYHSNRLDLTTAIMRGRQAISETTRDLEGLHDTRRNEVAIELQAEQAALDQLALKRTLTQTLLLEELAPSSNSTGNRQEEARLTYSVSRRVDGQVKPFSASETTVLLPADVVRVVRTLPLGSTPSPSASTPPTREQQTSQASQ